MARYCNWSYEGIDANNIVTVRYRDQVLRYRLLHTIEFNSDRKRMSVIVEQLDPAVVDADGKTNEGLLNSMDNRIFVYGKGADNVIIERLKLKDES